MSTIDEMVNRFLAWKLPADFSPDGGVSFSTFYEPDSPHWPTGTNLLTAQQAKGMFTHALAGDSETEGLRAALDQMHAEYEDMKSLLLGNARNLNLERERLHAALQLAVWAMRAPAGEVGPRQAQGKAEGQDRGRLAPEEPEVKTTASMRLSVSLQGIASQIEDALADAAGERVSWALMVNADDVTQYVSNCDRKDGVELIESLLARWKAGRADIPAHMNPDLPRAK